MIKSHCMFKLHQIFLLSYLAIASFIFLRKFIIIRQSHFIRALCKIKRCNFCIHSLTSCSATVRINLYTDGVLMCFILPQQPRLHPLFCWARANSRGLRGGWVSILICLMAVSCILIFFLRVSLSRRRRVACDPWHTDTPTHTTRKEWLGQWCRPTGAARHPWSLVPGCLPTQPYRPPANQHQALALFHPTPYNNPFDHELQYFQMIYFSAS